MAMQSQSKKILNKQGFLLIELLVALLLIAVFTYIIACYQSISIQTGHEAIMRWQAVNMISSFLAKATVDATLLKKKNYEEDGYVISWQKISNNMPRPHFLEKNKNFSYFALNIVWDGYDKKKHSYHCVAGLNT